MEKASSESNVPGLKEVVLPFYNRRLGHFSFGGHASTIFQMALS
jgi:hypothetical protein